VFNVPSGDELLDEVADMIPPFIASEALGERGPKLISKRGPNMAALMAPAGAGDARRKRVEAPSKVGEGVLNQFHFALTSLRLCLAVIHLVRRAFDQAFHERLDVTRWRVRAKMAQRAFQVGRESQADVCRGVSGKFPLDSGDSRGEPNLTRRAVRHGPRTPRRGRVWLLGATRGRGRQEADKL